MTAYDTRLPHSQQPKHTCKPNPYLIGITVTWGTAKLLIEAEPLDYLEGSKLNPNNVCRRCYFLYSKQCPKFAHRGGKYDCKRHKIIFTKVQD